MATSRTSWEVVGRIASSPKVHVALLRTPMSTLLSTTMMDGAPINSTAVDTTALVSAFSHEKTAERATRETNNKERLKVSKPSSAHGQNSSAMRPLKRVIHNRLRQAVHQIGTNLEVTVQR